MVHYAFLTFSLPGHLTCMVTLAEKLIKVHPDLTVTIYTIDAAADKCAPIKAMPGLNIVTLKLGPNGGNVKELFTYSLEQPAQLADDVLLGIKNDLSSRAGVTYPSVAVSNQYGSTWGRQVAAKMGIKSYIFMPSPMIVWTVQMLLPQVYASGFDRKGFLEVPHYGLLNHLQLLDMGGMVDGLAEQCRLAQTHDGMLINDQEETYDSHYIAALKEYIPNVRFIGYLPPATDFSKPPAPKQAQSTCPEVQGPESLVLPWLDRQGPRSVIYIAMGSWVHLCKADQVELAFALEKVGRPVVWTIKKYNETVPYRPSHAGKDYKERECKVQCDEYGLPEGWLDRMGDRVLIVEWAPQTTILSHSSTGLFISHCGWNSLTECVSLGGIPIVGVPIFTDQPINAHMLEHKLKIGKNLWSNPTEGELDRHLVADTIYEVMGNQVFAENAAKLKRHNDRRWNGASGDSMKKLKEFCDEVESK
ncbi:hypothetical protein BX616_002484 [Lobosporangium transversale]|uniref:UDP-glycosyltransferases domain-containing protein n=1 Tax=Lobosporangium transversale TaxID=64571 RepID=A0A1Y2G787_9FUNG|nr:hypothetical protein BCR41DRAFT_231840 [Lobosporangium transversale]KAF9900825.1 hypothetical protein BX616_002484 [Lobosporangium transversale]ORY96108.1 hypothetical protein BCR41DRAFT_231840 [Lobosporangium transversale]|eukprot:XP_021875527.1 hypothetical protein BCR41DRAFT_231840 [Lobosporangium transversale]